MWSPHCRVNPFQCYRNRSLRLPVTFRRPVSRRMEGIGLPLPLSLNGSGLMRSWILPRRRIAACKRALEVSGRRPREALSMPRTEAVAGQGRASEHVYFRTGIHERWLRPHTSFNAGRNWTAAAELSSWGSWSIKARRMATTLSQLLSLTCRDTVKFQGH